MSLEVNFFFTAPVEIVRVTKANLQEAADWCGGRVARVESRKVKGRIDEYVWVPTPEGTKISWAFPGMIITKRIAVAEENILKETYAVFRRDYFSKNFFNDPAEALEATWGRRQKEMKEEARKARTVTIELPEGANVEEAKMEILKQYSNLETTLDKQVLSRSVEFDGDQEAGKEPSPVEQRMDIRAEMVEAEARPDVPKVIGDALTPFEIRDPHQP